MGRMFARLLALVLMLGVVLTAGCASAPPKHQDNLCAIFDQYPEWYDAAKASEDKWGTPSHILMAFVKAGSSFRHDAKPSRDWFLFISSAGAGTRYGPCAVDARGRAHRVTGFCLE